MAMRVRVRLRSGSRDVVTSAVINTGFKTDTPNIAIPTPLARMLGLWPLSGGELISLETGGGETEAYLVNNALSLSLELEDRVVGPIMVNAIINPNISEVLISDYVTTQLGIVILNAKEGLWRLMDENKVRKSVEPTYWL